MLACDQCILVGSAIAGGFLSGYCAAMVCIGRYLRGKLKSREKWLKPALQNRV